MEKYGYIYITRNLIDNKRYIGQKSLNKFNPNYKGSGKLLWRSINKYGWDNFEVQLLEWCYSKEELDEREIFWISYYDAVNSDMFYNLSAGGQKGHIKGSKLSDDTKDKLRKLSKERYPNGPTYNKIWITDGEINKVIDPEQLEYYERLGWYKGFKNSTIKKKSDAMLGSNNPMYRKQHSDEWKQNMSEKLSGQNNPFYGKKHSEESRRKISESRVGINNPCYNKIWITKDTLNKRISADELDYYISQGWKKGRYVSNETREKHRNNVKSRRDSETGRFK